jgi:hypothetical protein
LRRRDNVTNPVLPRVDDRLAHLDLGREVDDRIDRVRTEYSRHRVFVADVSANEHCVGRNVFRVARR